MHQRNLAGVTFAAEHAFAEERSPKRHAIEPADQFAVVPAFDGVCVAHVEQRGKEGHDPVIDPGAWTDFR